MSQLVFITLFAPLLSSLFFSILEAVKLKRVNLISQRSFIYILFGISSIFVSLFVSSYFINPLIDFYSFFNLTSISNVESSLIIKMILTICALDFSNYLIHRFTHFVPLLWRFHRLHHSERQVDAMTTIFHHPIEVLINNIFIIACYVIFDLPIIFIFFYDIAFALFDAFAHSNLQLPVKLEKYLSYIFVMPRMHRTHHALDKYHGNTNYGIVFSFWDKFFGTYSVMDANKTNPIKFGIEDAMTPKSYSARELLINPFI